MRDYIGGKQFAMAVFFLWIVFSLLIGAAGKGRKIGFATAFFCSLILSPLVGAIAVGLSKSVQQEAREKQLLALQQEQAATLEAMRQQGQPGLSVADELQKLVHLREAGHLTADEYEAQRGRLLS